MNETQQPEALRLAAWLNEGAWRKMSLGDTEAAGRELRRQHAEIETLRQGYDAARLEVESLRAAHSGIQWQCGPQANGFTAPGVPSERSSDYEAGWKAGYKQGAWAAAPQQDAAGVTAGAVPDGWKLVPVEPTPEMPLATGRKWPVGSQAEMAVRAELAAAPQPPADQKEGEA